MSSLENEMHYTLMKQQFHLFPRVGYMEQKPSFRHSVPHSVILLVLDVRHDGDCR